MPRSKPAGDAVKVADAHISAIGRLHGLPLVVKDVTETAGLRTTYGYGLYRKHVLMFEAEGVARSHAAGAISLGNADTPALATGANVVSELFCATLNPCNTALSPAGARTVGAHRRGCGAAAWCPAWFDRIIADFDCTSGAEHARLSPAPRTWSD